MSRRAAARPPKESDLLEVPRQSHAEAVVAAAARVEHRVSNCVSVVALDFHVGIEKPVETDCDVLKSASV